MDKKGKRRRDNIMIMMVSETERDTELEKARK